jgi:DNA-binding transcriptional regulator YiaG
LAHDVPTITLMRPGEFREIRVFLHMSHRTLARRLNVTPDVIARWESGGEPVPGLIALAMNALQRLTERRRAS